MSIWALHITHDILFFLFFQVYQWCEARPIWCPKATLLPIPSLLLDWQAQEIQGRRGQCSCIYNDNKASVTTLDHSMSQHHPFYLPLPLPSYQARDLAAPDTGSYDPSAHEKEPTDLTVGITIENLTKIYGVSWVFNQ